MPPEQPPRGTTEGRRNLIEGHPEVAVRIEAPAPHYVQGIAIPAAYDT
jgi:hypothetical protein